MNRDSNGVKWWERLGDNYYRIGWSSGVNSRRSLRSFVREQHRDTDLGGVLRFCRKWGLKPPQH